MQRANLPLLNFPRQYDFDIGALDGRQVILDRLRCRYVPLTPEEWVRQNLVQHLIQDLGYPPGLIAIEKYLDYHGKLFRADVVIHDRQGGPLLVAECKEPAAQLVPQTFEQIATYNRVIRARYLLVTNGLTHYCCALDLAKQQYRFLKALPQYEEL